MFLKRDLLNNMCIEKRDT